MRAIVLITRILALSIAAAAAAAQPPAPPPDTNAERDQLALAALEGLMAAPPERALPLLRKVLSGAHRDGVKARALFVLAQIDTPDAQTLLIDTARSSSGSLQREAIRAIGIGGDAAALDALAGLYGAGDDTLKDAVLQAYMIAGRKQAIFEIARNATSERDLERAVHLLGALNATQELRKLGELHVHSQSLLHAYAIAGDLDSLRRIAGGGGDTAVDAVRSIGIIGSEDARQALRELYRNSAGADLKEAALQGLMIAGDERGVLELYRASTRADEKKALLRTLSMMGGDAALEAIDAALQGDRP